MVPNYKQGIFRKLLNLFLSPLYPVDSPHSTSNHFYNFLVYPSIVSENGRKYTHTHIPHPIPSKEIPGLISFRMDWLDLHAVQGTLKTLPQHHSSKKSILWRSAFFTVQLSHPYMTTGKTIALTRRTLLAK